MDPQSFLAHPLMIEIGKDHVQRSAFFQYSDRSLLANWGPFLLMKTLMPKLGYVPGKLWYIQDKLGYFIPEADL